VGLDWCAPSDRDFYLLLTIGILLIPACCGYPWFIHRLTDRGKSDEYRGLLGNREGATTTPLDMAIAFDHDRFDLVLEDSDCVPSLGCGSGAVRQQMARRRLAKVSRSRDHGKDDSSLACWTGPEAG
jgi:xylulose-5-phosphate/fructose-6-phosphate phosphoketolase